MIGLSELEEIHPVYVYPKGETVSFDAIKELISKTASEFNVPVAFALDEIVSGKLPNLTVEDCLILYHPEHQHDFFKIVFCIRREGGIACICKYSYGATSKPNHTAEAEQNYYTALMAIFKYIKC